MISLTSVIIAGVLGLAIAIIISEYRIFAKFTLNMINFIYIIPSISLLGLLIPFYGIGNTTAIIALCLYALLPMVRNTYAGLINIDNKIIDTALGLGSSRLQVIYKIKIPLCLPIIIAGLRNMTIMTIALAGIASFVGAGGLGVAIYRGITTNNQSLILAGSLLMILLALLLDFVIAMFEKRATISYKIKHKNSTNKPFVVAMSLLVGIVVGLGIYLFTNKKEGINIASKPMSEQYIIAEMLKFLIEQDLGVDVKLTLGVGGGTANIQVGMESGEFDLYPEYTATAWNMVLKQDSTYQDGDFSELQRLYKERFDMEILTPYGFENTFGLAMRREVADTLHIKSFSDLSLHTSKLAFGAEYDFYDRRDGYTGLTNAYNMTFKKTFDIDIGLKYKALLDKEVDIINVFTTDAGLSDKDIVLLDDDKAFYPSYKAITIARGEILRKYPQLKATLSKLENRLDNEQMATLNARVERDKVDSKIVALEFLQKEGLLR